MRKSMIVAALSIVMVGAWVVTAGGGATVSAQDEYGYQPSGTWAWFTHRPSGGAVPAIITYHKDGTITGSDGIMFGIDFPPALNVTKESPLHGVWERTGSHSFRGTSLWMQFAANGNVIAWGRARSNLYFVDDPDHFEGMMYLDSLPCVTPFTCPDPIASAWTSSMISRAVSAVRLTRVEPPGF